RRTQPNLSRPFSVPFYPVTPVLGILLNVLLALFIPLQTWLIAIGWLTFGGAVYVVYDRFAGGGDTGEPAGADAVRSGGPTPDTDIEPGEN
ncbi:MAG: amino acid permease C-terminal domain-containing protein, partial [Salinirussus sp.]